MPLESLLELVETLRKRIGGHRAALSGNEMLTRYALIDPLLRELGWDTSDPAIVVPEDTSVRQSGRPDYVLRTDGRSSMVIEAKKLKSSDFENGATQAFNYANNRTRQARYFGITDGQRWEIYDLSRPANDMKVVSFDIMASSPSVVCLQALVLWRPTVEANSASAAPTPIVGIDVETAAQVAPTSISEDIVELPSQTATPQNIAPAQVTHQTTSKPAPQHTDTKWIPLSEFKPQTRSRPPLGLMFPDNSPVVSPKNWVSLVLEIIQWLELSGHLNSSHCPIRTKGRRYILHTHRDIDHLDHPISVGSFYYDGKYSGPRHVRNAQTIAEHANQDPAQFKVRLP